MLAPSEQPEVDISSAIWYLGIDFGTTGISAVLLNQSTAKQYPIYWSKELQISYEELRTLNPQLRVRSSGETIFRLPAITYSGSAASQLFVQQPVAPIIVGSLASSLANKQPGIFLQNFKPYLKTGIPYYCPERQDWEPILHLHNQQLVSLYWVRRTLQALLATLTPKSTLPEAVMKVGVIGLKPETLGYALGQLKGVILGCPANWGDTYRLNLREAVLEAKLVRYPEQIFFLEDAIATFLTAISSSQVNVPEHEIEEGSNIRGQGEQGGQGGQGGGGFSRQPSPPSPQLPISPAANPITQWRGGTLVINAGATTTELALVTLPDEIKYLTHDDFCLQSLLYGGNAIEQDIFCQLLYPQMSSTQLQQLSLNDDLELPLPGQADKSKRDRLALMLQSSPFGQALLKAAGYLKLILQHKDEFTLELGTEQWLVKRLDLETHIILPFIQQLNRHLNALMIEAGLSEQGIYQAVCVGGTAGLGALEKWLEQKLPKAAIVPDLHEFAHNKKAKFSSKLSTYKTDSWVATGLATLPLYPQLLNRSQQQYSDYFLLSELLRAFPETTDNSANRLYSLEEIVQHLERRGLNTGTCYERLVRLVKGQLPLGIVPSSEDDSTLSQASRENLYYSQVLAEPLFSQEGQLYRLNLQQQQYLRQYLELVLSGTRQKFEDPLIVSLGTRDI
jgi:hypothetical protein